MRKPFVVLLLLSLGYTLSTQAQAPEVSPVERFAQSISPKDLQSHIYFLADDLLEGRETGERGQHLAGLYIKTRFMRYGLKPIVNGSDYYQMFYMNRAILEEAKMTIGDQELEFRKDFFAFGANMPDKTSGKLSFVGYGIQSEEYDNLKGVNLTGKIAVALAGSPKEIETEGMRMWEEVSNWQSRKAAIEDAGAEVLLLIVPDSTYKTISRFARTQSMDIGDKNEPPFPMLYVRESSVPDLFEGSKKTVAELHQMLHESDELPKTKLKKISMTQTAKITRTSTPAMNVLGFLEGSEYPDEVIVVTGHYDHIGLKKDGTVNNGANDDASGTSGVLEMAEAFGLATEAGYRPKRSMLFMTVSGEEKGLLGSEFYVEHPVIPLANTVADLNIDMIGRIGKEYQKSADSTNYIYVIGADKLSSELHEISEAANQQYTNLKLDYTYNDENDPNRFYYRSDHYNFAKNGIPVAFYFNGTHADYHKPGDDAEKINYELAAQTTRLVFYTAWELANREKRIVVDKEMK